MSKQPGKKSNNSLLAPLAVGFSIGTITIGTVFLVLHHDREPNSYAVYRKAGTSASVPSSVVPPLTVTPVTNPDVTRVASRFICSCGTCGGERLDVCSCETAKAERLFIQEQLRQGRTEAEAVEAVKEKYGGLES